MAFDPITELQRAFALVRPVGMSDSAARDWLAAAVGEVRHLPEVVLRAGLEKARRECSHHGQIIPTIMGSNWVKGHQAHQRELTRLQRDGHQLPGREAPAISQRGGIKQIGKIANGNS